MSIPAHRIRKFDDWLEAQGHRFEDASISTIHERYRDAALALVREHPTALPLDVVRWYWAKAQDIYWATTHAPTQAQIMAAFDGWQPEQTS